MMPSLPSLLTLALALALSGASAAPLPNSQHAPAVQRRATVDYYSPLASGGSMLGTFSGAADGEPLNVIISGKSDPKVLTTDGFQDYYESLDFDMECFNLHSGGPMMANLGDGNGPKNQTKEVREGYDISGSTGSCLESLIGGNHFRIWQQNGGNANSGAWFLAASIEENVTQAHTIEPDGYDKGRDAIVNTAVQGTTGPSGQKYKTTATYVSGLLQPGSNGINHNISIDGRVALLTVSLA